MYRDKCLRKNTRKLTIALIFKCHFYFYLGHSRNKWNCGFTHTHSGKKLLLVDLLVLHVVGELLLLLLLWSWKELDLATHGNCCIHDDEDFVATFQKTNLDNCSIFLSPCNPRAPQENNPIYNSFWTSQINPNANSFPLVFTCASVGGTIPN